MSDVKVYSTKHCPWCQRAKQFLKENGVAFKEVDVSSDEDAAREMIEKSGQMGVPVIEIDGEIIVGFDQNAIKRALKI